MPIFRAMRTISSLSMPTTGRRMGREHTAVVARMASMVWLATWPRHSPVTRARRRTARPPASAMRIMNRRMSTVNSSSGQFCGAAPPGWR